MSKGNKYNYSSEISTPIVEQENNIETDTAPIETPIVEAPATVAPAVTIEPKVVATQIKSTPVQNKPIATAQAPSDVARFNEMCASYITIMKKGITSEAVKKSAIIQLQKMLRFVMLSTKTEVFEACLKFFLTNRNIMMQQSTVLAGMTRYIVSNRIDDLVKLYILFYSLVESRVMKTKFTLNISHIKSQFNNAALANWVTIKK